MGNQIVYILQLLGYLNITLNDKYDIRASFLDIMQLKSSIPIEWENNHLNNVAKMTKNIPSGNIFEINNIFKTIKKKLLEKNSIGI